MEVIVNNECFSKAVSDVCRAISFKSSLPILTGIHLVADGNSLTLIGGNTEIFIKKTISPIMDGVKVLDIIEKGNVVLSGRYLNEIVKKLPGDIHVKVKNNQLVMLQSEGIVTSLNSFLSEEYPNLPKTTDANSCKVPRQDLIEMIKQTAFAASTGNLHPILTGVRMTIMDNHLSFAATNSHRLAFKKIEIQSDLNTNIIVPSKTLNELIKLMYDGDDEIKIFITNSYIVFTTKNTYLFSRLIEGSYPNIDGLLPQEFKTTIKVNRIQFLNGMDRASLFASEWKNNNVHLEMKEESKLTISSMSSEVGKIQETQPVLAINGDSNFRITLNGNFLLEMLKVIKEDEITLNFSGSMKPVLIKSVGNPSNYYIISPVRSN